jgi:hypothetical protein
VEGLWVYDPQEKRGVENGDRGRRSVYGGTERFQTDPHWRDHIFFYEYFPGDNAAGLGASHQTVWTGVITKLMQMSATLDPPKYLEYGKGRAVLFGAQ